MLKSKLRRDAGKLRRGDAATRRRGDWLKAALRRASCSWLTHPAFCFFFSPRRRVAASPRPCLDRRVSASPRPRVFFIACCLLFASGCRMDMQDQPRFEVYESSTFFKDGLSSRPLVEGTVPRGYLKADKEFYTGKIDRSQSAPAGSNTAAPNTPPNTLDNASANTSGNMTQASATTSAKAQGDPNDVATFPFPVTEEIVNRGQERFRIYCAMCHGETGYGDGMIVRRGFRKPPSYHTDDLRNARVGHFFDVITNGWGSMPSYNAQIPAQDRWAIIAYIRALQKSQEGASAAHAPAQTGAQAPSTGGPK